MNDNEQQLNEAEDKIIRMQKEIDWLKEEIKLYSSILNGTDQGRIVKEIEQLKEALEDKKKILFENVDLRVDVGVEKNYNKILKSRYELACVDNVALIEELANIKELHTLALNLNADLNLSNSNFKQEIKILKQNAKIAINDKNHRKKILSDTVEELKQSNLLLSTHKGISDGKSVVIKQLTK
jgi:hypothetical protein